MNIGPYRIYFYSHEPNEAPHVHVDRDEKSVKFWINPVSLSRNLGFSSNELSKIRKIVEENKKEFLEYWNGYFGIGC